MRKSEVKKEDEVVEVNSIENGFDTNSEVVRNYKDTVFVDLFASDITAGDNIFSLVNALFGSHFDKKKDEYMITRIEGVLYNSLANDIGVTIDNKLLVLGEHQSTINENMPWRCLMYAGRVYERIKDKGARFKPKTVKLPYPQFIVFYNGEKNYDDKILKLSDAFYEPEEIGIYTEDKEPPLELRVRVININADKHHKILEKCKILGEYSKFIAVTRKKWRRGMSETERSKSMYWAIDWCIKNDILKEYLTRKRIEVCNMLIAEYDEEEKMAVLLEEAEKDIKKERERAEAEKKRADLAEAKAKEEKERADMVQEEAKAKVKEEKEKTEIARAQVKQLEKEKLQMSIQMIKSIYMMKISKEDAVEKFHVDEKQTEQVYRLLSENEMLKEEELAELIYAESVQEINKEENMSKKSETLEN